MMKLYVEPMDAVVLAVAADGKVQLESDGWTAPTLQERRAILWAAKQQLEWLQELIDTLDPVSA